MIEIVALVLVHNESVHIERLMKNLLPRVDKVLIVDSYSDDGSPSKLNKYENVDIIQNAWINYANQFDFGQSFICNNYKVDYILRIDADETLESDESLHSLLLNNGLPDAVVLNRWIIWRGKKIRYGGVFPMKSIRLFNPRKGKIEKKYMDEHIAMTSDSHIISSNVKIFDENLNNIRWWTEKHLGYAYREALDSINEVKLPNANRQVRLKQFLKLNVFYRTPRLLRGVLYFLYRYFFRLGFLDGRKGFEFHFFQALWYRTLVDIIIEENESK